MRTMRILAGVTVVAMVAAIAYGFANGGFSEEASSIWALPWGKVTLIDLYAGLVLFGAWIAFRERRASLVVLWWLALVVLGNLAAGVYLVVALHGSDDTSDLLLGRFAASR